MSFVMMTGGGAFGFGWVVNCSCAEREFPALLVVWAYQQKQLFFWKRAVFFVARKRGKKSWVFFGIFGVFLCFLGVFCAFCFFLLFARQRKFCDSAESTTHSLFCTHAKLT